MKTTWTSTTETRTAAAIDPLDPPARLRETVSASQPGEPRPTARKPRPTRWWLAGAATTVIGAGLFIWWQSARTWVDTDNAFVAGHIHQVSSRVAGTVQEVFVTDNQEVAAGQLLARLDPRDFHVRHRQAEAALAQARAEREQTAALMEQATAQIRRDDALALKARTDLQRAESLYDSANGAISAQELDQARAAHDAAQATLEAARSALNSAQARTNAAAAQVRLAEAALEETALQLTYAEIRAPVAGRVGRRNLEAGNRVQPGQALLAIVNPEIWLVANFKETQLHRLQPGRPARIQLDAFPDWPLEGTVESFSPASGAQFALLPPDNATGNFTRIVQRVPVKIVLTDRDLARAGGRVVPGMSARVRVRAAAVQGMRP
jgi:membrane fusion protein (multidrug efflux system)